MKKLLKPILIFFWLLTFSIVFAMTWLRTPSLWFINLPRSIWDFLANTLGTTCCESSADLEVAVGLAFGLLFALIFLFVGGFFLRKLVRLTRRSSGR